MAFIPANIGGGGGTGTNLTPSNSTPAQITSGNDYHATGNGYAIASYSSVTPSDSNPPAIASGDIVKTTAAGYLLESASSGAIITKDTLWTNPTPTANFTSSYITLSNDFTNYDYLKIVFRRYVSNDTEYSVIIPATAGLHSALIYGDENYSYKFKGFRGIYLNSSSHTTINIETQGYSRTAATTVANAGSSSTDAKRWIIPVSVVGIKITGGSL